ncbi:MAG TPA: hypothetical protein VE379_11180 [Vicinamibacterales bacterium]|nr:hypothetical protein [Vicinamibacterales bacterium]
MTAPPVHDQPYARQQHRAALTVFVAAFTYVFLANAWLGDDAYITFRVIWNAVHGYGLVFNPGERVQAFTHPLWMLVMTAVHAVTREFLFSALAVSYAFALAAVLAAARSAQRLAAAAVAVLWLLSSKAFVDYTSSGLEYPLSYLLLALFHVRLLQAHDRRLTDSELRWVGALAGLAFVNRMDSVLLFAPALVWLAWRGVRGRGARLLPLVLGFALPAAAWVIFATLYYGFPLPNTYYAKVATGIPSGLLYRQGVAYVLNSLAHDPITLLTIGIALALGIGARAPVRLAALGAAAYVLYTISVGGDFMSGRFFAMPFLVSVIAVLHAFGGVRWELPAAGALVVYTLLAPLAPIKTTTAYEAAWPWRSQNGVKDERGNYHRATNPFLYSPLRPLPDHTWIREGLSFRASPEKVTVQGSIGFFGLAAGPEKHLVDRNALSDAFLARLPVSPRLYFEFYVGHYFRDIPEGYLDSLARGTNELRDPALRAYYGRLLQVIRGPLFTRERLASMWYLNAGEGRRFARRYAGARPVDVSIRASNERFGSDVGVRTADGHALRSDGRPGYLQYGPGIPMPSGTYRARWIGAVEGGAHGDGQELGFVDVWDGERRLAYRPLSRGEVQPESRRLGEVDFVLPEATNHLEYRLWVNGGTPVMLERVELASIGR